MEWRQQWLLVKSEPWLLAMVSWIPLLLALVLWWIFSQGIARNLPIGVVDRSHDRLSYQIINSLDQSAALQVDQVYRDEYQASRDLQSGKVYAYITIPYQFDKSIYRAEKPQISVFYNSQFVLVGKVIQSAVNQVLTSENGRLTAFKKLGNGNLTIEMAAGSAVSARVQIDPLFNQNTSYEPFLVAGLIPALWQVIIMVVTVLVLDANRRQRGLTNWLAKRSCQRLIITLSPYVCLFWLQGILFLLSGYGIRHWPMHGSWNVIVFAQFIMVIACVIMSTFIYFALYEPARALSFVAVFAAPSFAFMGITFPISDMNKLAILWRSLLPSSHYIAVQMGQVNYGISSLPLALKPLLPMFGYLILALFVLLLITLRIRQDTEGVNL